ncbi:MAG: YdcF family protein [Bryobacteraceae bacterium]
MKRWIFAIAVLMAAVAAVSLWRLTAAIERQAEIDEAREADVIVVLGAAEYRGKPSPVLRARLDHALELYRKKLAPRILTTGGAGGDPLWTESEVGRTYLSKHGVPVEAIIIEPEGESTVESTTAASEIMRRMNLRSCIVVSDGYHIFRAKTLMANQGFVVYGSPRPSAQPVPAWAKHWLSFRQAVGLGLWAVGIRI